MSFVKADEMELKMKSMYLSFWSLTFSIVFTLQELLGWFVLDIQRKWEDPQLF